MNTGNPNPNPATRFTAKYQPGKRGPEKNITFKRYLRCKVPKVVLENMAPGVLEYLDVSGNTDPTVFDAIAANIIIQALHPSPSISQPAMREVLVRALGKPVQVHKMEEDEVIEMEEQMSIDLSGFDREKLKEYESMTKEGIEAAHVVNETETK